jgi:hypothetical protein
MGELQQQEIIKRLSRIHPQQLALLADGKQQSHDGHLSRRRRLGQPFGIHHRHAGESALGSSRVQIIDKPLSRAW